MYNHTRYTNIGSDRVSQKYNIVISDHNYFSFPNAYLIYCFHISSELADDWCKDC